MSCLRPWCQTETLSLLVIFGKHYDQDGNQTEILDGFLPTNRWVDRGSQEDFRKSS